MEARTSHELRQSTVNLPDQPHSASSAAGVLRRRGRFAGDWCLWICCFVRHRATPPRGGSGLSTIDPATLHIDCSGTVAAVRAPCNRTLGAGSERAHIWSWLLTSHEDITTVKVKGDTNPCGSQLRLIGS